MEKKTVTLWKPISFSEKWEKSKTIKLDIILPSWTHKRKVLKEIPKEFDNFMNRLKRRHAIETGVVEKLYDLKEGITETFIKEGFIDNLLQHGDTNIDPEQLMAYLHDNFDALDFVFDVVNNNRPITVSFIKELHQLITKHQDSAEGRDQFGTKLKIPLLKGAFKERENNPTRTDGTTFLYCPPLQVDSEMDNFISILDNMNTSIHPIIKAAWAHHAFTNIHPFQDGNGRIARLLASLILIKHDLFPFTVIRTEKKKYIDALESADNGEPQALIDFFCEMQKRNILEALNVPSVTSTSFDEVVDILANKLEKKKEKILDEKGRLELIGANRMEIMEICKDSLKKIKLNIESRLNGNMKVNFIYIDGGIENDFWELIVIARNFLTSFKGKYDEGSTHFINWDYDVEWIQLIFEPKIEDESSNRYNLSFVLHNYGNEDYTYAIGSILHKSSIIKNISFVLPPYTISLESKTKDIIKSKEDIYDYLQSVVTAALAQIASEINE